MEIQKGIAYCGLVCALCSENDNCVGCRNEGCKDKDWCKNFQCCKAKNIKGCWECKEFPCKGSILDNIRIRAFAKFIRQYSLEHLLQCLENNEKNGIVYHYPGKLKGDYDVFTNEDEIIKLILEGK